MFQHDEPAHSPEPSKASGHPDMGVAVTGNDVLLLSSSGL